MRRVDVRYQYGGVATTKSHISSLTAHGGPAVAVGRGPPQRGIAPAWYPRDFSVNGGVVSLLRSAVAAFAVALLEVTATSWHRPREASTANPLSSLPLSPGRPSNACYCSGWPCGQRAVRAGCGSHTARTCRKSLNQRCGNASSNPMDARSAFPVEQKIPFRTRRTHSSWGARSGQPFARLVV